MQQMRFFDGYTLDKKVFGFRLNTSSEMSGAHGSAVSVLAPQM